MRSGLPPISPPSARILILGSFPGEISLIERQYYAHPRNYFWPIMHALGVVESGRPYEERIAAVMKRGIALWDVCESAERKGSLDSSIRRLTVVPNDIGGLLELQPQIAHIFFNGKTAESFFRRFVLPSLNAEQSAIPRTGLPSTSPAYASMPFSVKLEHWRAILRSS
jgi:TDG/mug DNA glycosylase family protein